MVIQIRKYPDTWRAACLDINHHTAPIGTGETQYEAMADLFARIIRSENLRRYFIMIDFNTVRVEVMDATNEVLAIEAPREMGATNEIVPVAHPATRIPVMLALLTSVLEFYGDPALYGPDGAELLQEDKGKNARDTLPVLQRLAGRIADLSKDKDKG